MIDLFLVYSFIRRLSTPFSKWSAFKEGVIDERGNVLVKKKDRTSKQRKAYGSYDRLVLNIKKLLEKVPGGKTRLGSYMAALYLIKEHNMFYEGSLLTESHLDIHQITEDLKQIFEEPTNNIGSGAVAGLGVGPDGEPGLTKAQAARHKKRIAKIIEDEDDEEV